MDVAVQAGSYRLGFVIALFVVASTGRAGAAITMTPNPVNVGNVAVGSSGSTTGTLASNTNAGGVDLVIGNCSGGSGMFTLSPNADISLNGSNAMATITVTYAPDASGIQTCTVHVYQKNTTTELATFSIRGNGQQPPMLTVSDPPNFGALRYNNSAPLALRQFTRTITVRNDGDATLDISNVVIGGTNPTDFTFTGGTTGSLIGGATQSWNVTFNPNGSTAGARTATMTFTSNAPMMNSMRSINLAGTATTAAITVSATVPFGTIPIGSASTEDVTLTNSTGATGINKGPLGVTVGDIQVVTGMGGAPGPSWFTFTCGGSQTTSCTFAPPYSILTSTTIGVRCTPPSGAGTGTQNADITFTSDSDAGAGNVTRVTCQAGSSALAANMSSLDFAPLLVNPGAGVDQQFMLSNNGSISADFWLEVTGAGAGQFTATGVGCGTSVANQCTLVNGTSTMITVSFFPTIEGPISAALRIRTAGAQPSLSLAGRGVDKHLTPLMDIEFPDTFRNPGSTAPEQIVKVENYGEYMLQVNDLSINGDPTVWSLAEPFVPFSVPAGGSVDVRVKFTPVVEGKAEPGGLMFDTDDVLATGDGMIRLTGNGKLRNVDMAPGSVDIGETFAGIPARLSISRPGDLITVINMDSAAFNIRDLAIEGADASMFVLQDLEGNAFSTVDIAQGESRTFDVVFNPTYPGDFEASVVLYLDEDPVGQSVAIRGRALFIDAHGSGGFGCSTGRGSGGAMVLLMVGVLASVRRRRR